MSGLLVEDLHFAYGGRRPVLAGISLPPLAPGQLHAVIGPNAAGKSTFFKCVAGILKARGRVRLDGVDLSRLGGAERAGRVAYLPQDGAVQAVLTVFEAVLLARRRGGSWRVDDADLDAVAGILEDVRIADLGQRYLNELSGGQRQLVSLAQALARAPRALLLDEPTSSLDLQHQLDVLELVRRVTVERNLVSLVAIHDLNLAARFADHLVVLAGGAIRGAGPPAEVLTPAMVRAVYGVEAAVQPGPDGHPQVTPLASIRPAPSAAPTRS